MAYTKQKTRNAPPERLVHKDRVTDSGSHRPAPDDWHPLVKEWYDALAASGQAEAYEPSDWAHARVWGEVLSRQLASGKVSAQMMVAWDNGTQDLLATVGARLRQRFEIVDVGLIDHDDVAAVTALDDYRTRLVA